MQISETHRIDLSFTRGLPYNKLPFGSNRSWGLVDVTPYIDVRLYTSPEMSLAEIFTVDPLELIDTFRGFEQEYVMADSHAGVILVNGVIDLLDHDK